MPGPHLVIRADAGPSIGTGHVMRCLAIAEAWIERDGAVTFMTSTQIRPLLNRIRSTGANLIRMDHATILSDDVAVVAETCQRLGAMVVVIDGYQFDYEYQFRLRDDGLIVTLVDDYAHLSRYTARAVLNQNSYASSTMYAGKVDEADFLMGSEFALIRSEFRNLSRHAKPDGSRLLITMGGADPPNMTELTLRGLRQCEEDIDEVLVVVGAANPHRERLEQECKSHKYNVRLLTATNDMSSIMASCDLAITAAGSTCWELEYLGIPYVTIVLAENQVALGESVGKIGGAVNLGWYESVTETAIAESVSRIKAHPPVSQLAIDGLGAFRAVDAIRSYMI